MARDECEFVAEYLQRFGESRENLDLERVGGHVAVCPDCHESMSEFFRVMEVPETDNEYLQETLDDLSLSIYNLVKALISDPPADDDEARENVRFVQKPGDAEQYVSEGAEIVEDVHDFVGADHVRGESMSSIRELMEDSKSQFGLALNLLDKATELGGRNALDCENLKGVLHLTGENLTIARQCFERVMGAPGADLHSRSVQVHAMNNLAYVHQLQSELETAIRWAGRSKAVAEELGAETFNCSFALMFFHLLRADSGDVEHAAKEIESIVAVQGGREEFSRCMGLETNTAIRSLYDGAGFGDRFAGLI